MPLYNVTVKEENLQEALRTIEQHGGTVTDNPMDKLLPALEKGISRNERGNLSVSFERAAPFEGERSLIIHGVKHWLAEVALPPATPVVEHGGDERLPVRVYGGDAEEVVFSRTPEGIPVLHVSYDSQSASVSLDIDDLLKWSVRYHPELIERARDLIAEEDRETEVQRQKRPRR